MIKKKLIVKKATVGWSRSAMKIIIAKACSRGQA
jgi:hypothetical protein